MRYSLLLLFAAALLSACGAGATPSVPGGTDDNGDDTVINTTAGLSAYPGATGSEVIPAGLDTKTTFSTDASLQQVYSHFDGQLTAQGWQQTSIENEDEEIEAEYTREGRGARSSSWSAMTEAFELKIDIDGDNADYDQDNGTGDGDDDDGGDDGSDDD